MRHPDTDRIAKACVLRPRSRVAGYTGTAASMAIPTRSTHPNDHALDRNHALATALPRAGVIHLA
jgi:hypothetical protein